MARAGPDDNHLGSLKWAWLSWATCAGAVRCGQGWEEAEIGEVEKKTRLKEGKISLFKNSTSNLDT